MATTPAHTTDSLDDPQGTTSAQGTPYACGKAVVAAWEALATGTVGGARLNCAIDDALASARIVLDEYDPDEGDRGVLRRQLEASAAQLWEVSLSTVESCESREALHADWMRALGEHLPSWEDVLPFGAYPHLGIGMRVEFDDPIQGVRKLKVVRPASELVTLVKRRQGRGDAFSVAPELLRPDLSHPGVTAGVAHRLWLTDRDAAPVPPVVFEAWLGGQSSPTHDDRLRVARAVVEVFGG